MTDFVPFESNKKLTTINFFGGPCVGKSTIAAGVFSRLKILGYKTELVHEFAKECVWEQRTHIFSEQDYIFAHQHRLLRRLVYHDIDYAIMDSPLLLSLMYLPEWYPASFVPFVMDVFNSYNNINILLTRNRQFAYDPTGRNQTLEQAQDKDFEIQQLLAVNNIDHVIVSTGEHAVDQIVSMIMNRSHNEIT